MLEFNFIESNIQFTMCIYIYICVYKKRYFIKVKPTFGSSKSE